MRAWGHSSHACFCFVFFIVFVNDLIKMLKERAGVDVFISWLRVLALMDDVELLATTRQNMILKQYLLKYLCFIA